VANIRVAQGGFPLVLSLKETFGSPKFLGSPFVGMPRSQTPVGRHALADTDLAILPSGMTTPSAATNSSLSRLNHAARWFAVYASQPGSPLHHAKLATGLLARLWPGRTFTRWAAFPSFKKLLYIVTPIPSDQACLGAVSSRTK
jgi:hypothetical protein